MLTTDYLIQSIRTAKQYINKDSNNDQQVDFPCSICNCKVKHNDKAILCTCCDLWVHIRCNNISVNEYIERQKRNRDQPESENLVVYAMRNI